MATPSQFLMNHNIVGATDAMPPRTQKYTYKAGAVLSSPPPFRVKDIINTTQYARGEYGVSSSGVEKGATRLHELQSPVTGQKVFQFGSGKGGQGEGF